MIVRVFLLSDPLVAFHSNPVTNETPWLLTSSLSSHHIKMFQLFLNSCPQTSSALSLCVRLLVSPRRRFILE